VVVVLGGGYTPSEQTMFEAGRWYEVREARQHWQDTMQARFIEPIEGLTGHRVQAFMSPTTRTPTSRWSSSCSTKGRWSGGSTIQLRLAGADGALALSQGEVARKLAGAEVNVEFTYATFGGCRVVFGVDDAAAAREVLGSS
jgi:hypothetical protein